MKVLAVYSEIHTKHINAFCGENVDFLNASLVVYSILTTELKVMIICTYYGQGQTHVLILSLMISFEELRGREHESEFILKIILLQCDVM
jgi:hypothetical protein